MFRKPKSWHTTNRNKNATVLVQISISYILIRELWVRYSYQRPVQSQISCYGNKSCMLCYLCNSVSFGSKNSKDTLLFDKGLEVWH